MNIIAFATSSNADAVSKKFVASVAKYYKEDTVQILDIIDYETPLFPSNSEDRQPIPASIQHFAGKLAWADLVIVSLESSGEEHTEIYRNLLAWLSCMTGQTPYHDIHLFLLSTSNSQNVNLPEMAIEQYPYTDADILEIFSLPEFEKNFMEGKGVVNMLYRSQLEAKVRKTKREMIKILQATNNNDEE